MIDPTNAPPGMVAEKPPCSTRPCAGCWYEDDDPDVGCRRPKEEYSCCMLNRPDGHDVIYRPKESNE